MLTVGDKFPAFNLSAVPGGPEGLKGDFVQITDESNEGKWKVVFFWPLDFTFVCPDPQGIIRHVSVNDLSVGRNPQEILRILDGLQSDELCPCNWKKGDAFIKA